MSGGYSIWTLFEFGGIDGDRGLTGSMHRFI